MQNIDTYYNPLGRIFKLKLDDESVIECTEMRTVSEDNLNLKMPEIYKHIIPFEKVWILDLSTQVGCPQSCMFCDIPAKTKFKRNLTAIEIFEQFKYLIDNTSYVNKCNKLRVWFARMGEPLYNIPNILEAIKMIKQFIIDEDKDFNVSFNISTMLPKKTFNEISGKEIFLDLLNEDVETTISLTSLDENERDKYYISNYYSINDILEILKEKPVDKKVKISLISIQNNELPRDILEKISNIPNLIIRLTNCCTNQNTVSNGIKDNDLAELNILSKLNIKTEILFVPYYKNYGLSCGQFL